LNQLNGQELPLFVPSQPEHEFYSCCSFSFKYERKWLGYDREFILCRRQYIVLSIQKPVRCQILTPQIDVTTMNESRANSASETHHGMLLNARI